MFVFGCTLVFLTHNSLKVYFHLCLSVFLHAVCVCSCARTHASMYWSVLARAGQGFLFLWLLPRLSRVEHKSFGLCSSLAPPPGLSPPSWHRLFCSHLSPALFVSLPALLAPSHSVSISVDVFLSVSLSCASWEVVCPTFALSPLPLFLV